MQNEKLFSKDGYYSFLVHSNALLHEEAMQQGQEVVAQYLRLHGIGQPVRILDLACGGAPITISEIMNCFAQCEFHYTGIDINPHQVQRAQTEFTFPQNVTRVHVIEGNAWELSATSTGKTFDIIFTGLNLHHGTPEEIYFLAQQLAVYLEPDGIFINHDWYRPDDQPYIRRPDESPQDPSESFRLIPQETLSRITIPQEIECDTQPGKVEDRDPPWRRQYRESLRTRLLARGGDPVGAQSTVEHVAMRDFPISLNQFTKIFEAAGFQVKIKHYGQGDYVESYTAMPLATRSKTLIDCL